MSQSEESYHTYIAPDTRYFKTQEEFDKAVSIDFVKYTNELTSKKQKFFVCLSHGQSPVGAYKKIAENYHRIKNPEYIYYTFLNSPLRTQTGLEGMFTAAEFLKTFIKNGFVKTEQIFGRSLDETNIENTLIELNTSIQNFLDENGKTGFDYVFLASNPNGRIGGIERNSKAFDSNEIFTLVTLGKDKRITATPSFLLKSRRVAFLATKADKRRTLAWLYSTYGQPNESPSFIRFIDDVKNRLTVFIDDKALTWPTITVQRETPYGVSNIVIDLPNPYKENAKEKLPVIILIHGFLGLNSFDGLLTNIASSKYIAAAMHYGSIPSDLPIDDYSKHVSKNIEAVVEFFGSKGHPVYLFDHSMGNTYFLMMDRKIDDYPGIKKYLHGRIGANPFFGEETKHALLGFLDDVIVPSMSITDNLIEKPLFYAFRRIVPLDTKKGVRKRSIALMKSLISQDTIGDKGVWKSIKSRIVFLMTTMDSLPQLNRIPIEKALNKVPAKIFVIQAHSAIQESYKFDHQVGLFNMAKYHIPILIIKSDRDGVAKYVPRLYESEGVEVLNVTDRNEKDFFREHLYHMIHPMRTANIIDDFITKTEKRRKLM